MANMLFLIQRLIELDLKGDFVNILYGISFVVFVSVPGSFILAIAAYPFLPKRAKQAIRSKLYETWTSIRERAERLIAEVRAEETSFVNTSRMQFRKFFLGIKEEAKPSKLEEMLVGMKPVPVSSEAITEKISLPSSSTGL